MVGCYLYETRVLAKLSDNMAFEDSVFILLALVKKDQMRNEKELIAFGLEMFSRIDN